jgi:prepilin-type N-terminal cleavage/methylation domain-containing protein
MMRRNIKGTGFTLIELLIAITIIAVLLAIAVPNFLGVRQRARDAKRKAELSELKKAMQLYYSDYNQYPDDSTPGSDGGENYQFIGCGTDGDEECPLNDGCEFAAGGADCTSSTIYMKRLPRIDTALSNFGYIYSYVDQNNFCMSVLLENMADSDILDSKDRCSAFCETHPGHYVDGRYIVCND